MNPEQIYFITELRAEFAGFVRLIRVDVQALVDRNFVMIAFAAIHTAIVQVVVA